MRRSRRICVWTIRMYAVARAFAHFYYQNRSSSSCTYILCIMCYYMVVDCNNWREEEEREITSRIIIKFTMRIKIIGFGCRLTVINKMKRNCENVAADWHRISSINIAPHNTAHCTRTRESKKEKKKQQRQIYLYACSHTTCKRACNFPLSASRNIFFSFFPFVFIS